MLVVAIHCLSEILGIDSMRKTILFLFVVLLTNGCVPIKYDYYYISFEGAPDIKTLTYGRAVISKLESHESMPVEYKLKRDRYIVFIETDKKSKRPASFIRAKKLEGQDLKIEAITNSSKCGGFDFLTVNIEDEQFLRYEWWGFVKAECLNKEIIADEMMISFRVIDDAGNLLGEERLPFKLIKNGIYIEQDAI